MNTTLTAPNIDHLQGHELDAAIAVMKIEDVLRRMYDSEINAEISCFWDGGFCVSLGDELNGFKEKSDCLGIEEVASELHRLILKHYPESEYANINHNTLPPVASQNAGE